MREDDLAAPVVEHFEAAFERSEIRLEEPYDHYGNRGVVDAYVRIRSPAPVDYLIELKSDPALRYVTGPNEILRQYRRMERYFYRDDEHDVRPKLARTGPGVHFLLLFAPTRRCVEHVREYRPLYESVDREASVNGVDARRTVAFLANLDRAGEGELGFCSVNGELAFGSPTFFEAVPADSDLASALRAADGVDF
jgi:hypothetical protein